MALPKVFSTGEQLFASDLNANFSNLDLRGINFDTLSFVESDFVDPNISPNVNNGTRWSFKRKMEGPETLNAPLNMPEGSVANMFVDPIGTETSSPSVRSRATGSSASAATSHPITLPGTIEAGDLLVIVFASRGEAGTLTPSNSSWERKGVYFSSDLISGIFTKISDGNDATNIVNDVASEFSAHASFAISGVSSLPPFVISERLASTANATHDEAELPLSDNRGRFWIAARVATSGTVPTGQPSGYSDFQTVLAGSGSSSYTNVATAEKTTTGTTNTETPGNWTSVSGAWITYVIGMDASGPYKLSYSNDYVGEKPKVLSPSLLQVIRLPDDDYAVVKSWEES